MRYLYNWDKVDVYTYEGFLPIQVLPSVGELRNGVFKGAAYVKYFPLDSFLGIIFYLAVMIVD